MNVVVVCVLSVTHCDENRACSSRGLKCTQHTPQEKTYMKEPGRTCRAHCTCSHTLKRNRAWSNLLCAPTCRMIYSSEPFPHGPLHLSTLFIFLFWLTELRLCACPGGTDGKNLWYVGSSSIDFFDIFVRILYRLTYLTKTEVNFKGADWWILFFMVGERIAFSF